MAKKKTARTIEVVLCPSSTALKITVAVLILCSTAALLALNWVQAGLRAETEKLLAEAAAVEYDNEMLKERTGKSDSLQMVRSIAREELGLVDPDTIVIDPIS